MRNGKLEARLLEHNFRCDVGEIDLIAEHRVTAIRHIPGAFEAEQS